MLRIAAFVLMSFILTSANAYGQTDAFCLVDNLTQYPHSAISSTPTVYRSAEQLSIRTVVHVVYSRPGDNVSDSTVQWLIEQVNMHFAGSDRDTSLIHPDHRPSITNTEIQFCLASADPDGGPTSGITHTETEIAFFSPPLASDSILIENVKQDSLGGKSPWNPENYFNIWIAPMTSDMSSSNYGLPYQNFFPLDVHGSFGQGVPGAVLDVYNLTGSPTVSAQKILTHEVGHVMGLFHVWGFPGSCDVDDYIEDTPICRSLTGACPSDQNTCADSLETRVDNTSNIMAYSCMEMFTPEQSTVMRSNIMAHAAGIVQEAEDSCDPTTSIQIPEETSEYELSIYPNPSSGVFTAEFTQSSSADVQIHVVSIDGLLLRSEYFENTLLTRHSFDMSSLPDGVYTLVITTAEHRMIEKLVLAH